MGQDKDSEGILRIEEGCIWGIFHYPAAAPFARVGRCRARAPTTRARHGGKILGARRPASLSLSLRLPVSASIRRSVQVRWESRWEGGKKPTRPGLWALVAAHRSSVNRHWCTRCCFFISCSMPLPLLQSQSSSTCLAEEVHAPQCLDLDKVLRNNSVCSRKILVIHFTFFHTPLPNLPSLRPAATPPSPRTSAESRALYHSSSHRSTFTRPLVPTPGKIHGSLGTARGAVLPGQRVSPFPWAHLAFLRHDIER